MNKFNALQDLDPLIHEPARLAICCVLNECKSISFSILLGLTELTRGNFSTHMARLVLAGYVDETKTFIDRKPNTEYQFTEKGRAAFKGYKEALKKLVK